MNTLHPSAAEVNFRVRPLGFDKGEVQAFISNLLNDYAQVTRELDRLRNEMAVLRDQSPDRRIGAPLPAAEPVSVVSPVAASVPAASASASTAREVERILAGAERIAEEMRTRALEESQALKREAEALAANARQAADEQLASVTRETEARTAAAVHEAETRATTLVRDAEARAAEVLREAEARATELVEGAVQQVGLLDRQAATIRTQCAHMRAAIRAASEAASTALREIDQMEDEREPAYKRA